MVTVHPGVTRTGSIEMSLTEAIKTPQFRGIIRKRELGPETQIWKGVCINVYICSDSFMDVAQEEILTGICSVT